MNRVEIFLNDIYKDANLSTPEIKDVIEELRIHLNQSVKELMVQGFDEGEATEIAIERFGGKEHVQQIFKVVHMQEKKFASIILLSGISIFITSLLLFIGLILVSDRLNLTYANMIYGVDGPHINKNSYEKIVDANWMISSVESRKLDGEQTVVVQDNSGLNLEFFENISTYQVDNNLTTLKFVDLRKIGFLIFIIGTTIYFVLSVLWGVISLYHKRRLNIISFILLITLNLFGYLFYKKIKD